jgi:hypothetical protein
MLASRRTSSIFGKVRHIDTHSDTGSRLAYPPQPHWANDAQAEFVICFKPIEQSHRNVKKRTWLAKGYGSFWTAWRTLQGIEAVDMIRKGRVRWVAKGDTVALAAFIAELFGVAA